LFASARRRKKTLLLKQPWNPSSRRRGLEFRGRKLLGQYHPRICAHRREKRVWERSSKKVMAVLGLEVKKGKSSA